MMAVEKEAHNNILCTLSQLVLMVRYRVNRSHFDPRSIREANLCVTLVALIFVSLSLPSVVLALLGMQKCNERRVQS